MTGIDVLIDRPVIHALGWALLHFIWQGTLVGAVAAVSLRVLRRSGADVRYVVATVSLSLMATLPVVTGLQAFRAAQAQAAPSVSSPAAAADPEMTGAFGMPAATPMAAFSAEEDAAGRTAGAPLGQWLPLFVLMWMAGVAVLAARLAGGWIWLQRLKSRDAVPADDALQALVRRLSRRLHIDRTITLLRSPVVDVPTVIGWLKPTVLLPVSALAGLSPLQVEAILAHELAHVRRHDYLVNLLQTLLETLLFYHPAVWWLSRQIRIERENCCDDLAVSLCGDPVVYARALADLEALRGPVSPLAMAATGGPLLDRVRRLLTGPVRHAGRGPAWLAAGAAVLLMLVVVGGAVTRQTLTAAAGTPQATPAPALDLTPDGESWEEGVTDTAVEQLRPPPPPPAPPAPPAPETGRRGTSVTHETNPDETSGNFVWSSNGEKIELKYRGRFELTADDTGISKVSPKGYLKIADGRWIGGRMVEFTGDEAGAMRVRYQVGGRERPFDPEGRQWLAQVLPRFIRMSGFAANERVARFLRTGGLPAVLDEISQIESSYGKKVYFTELLKQATLDPPPARRLLEQAGRELPSDYELATVLIAGADKLLVNDETVRAYFDAAGTIQSDYEMRRAFSAALKGGAVRPTTMTALLEAARGLESDYEAASLLLAVVAAQPIEGAVRAPFFAVLETLGSAYEKSRVLQALLRRTDVSAPTLLDVLKAAGTIGSGYEAGRVLQAAAGSHEISGAAREAYLKAADRLGGYEQNRALAALVRSEKH